MRKKFSLTLILCILAGLTAGCATTNSSGPGDQGTDSDSNDDSIQHIVVAGDRLGDIALRYTGAVSRWKAIAAYNDITDPTTLRIGDRITVPSSLIPESRRAAGRASDLSTNRESLDVASSSGANRGVATTTGTLALQRTVESTEKNTAIEEVIVRPIAINRRFELNPIAPADLKKLSSTTTKPPQIKVVGSYYPKGVYEQPASYSSLMMRVAPGTVFELEREINDWYKVITEQGVGYLRRVDGKLVPDD